MGSGGEQVRKGEGLAVEDQQHKAGLSSVRNSRATEIFLLRRREAAHHQGEDDSRGHSLKSV